MAAFPITTTPYNDDVENVEEEDLLQQQAAHQRDVAPPQQRNVPPIVALPRTTLPEICKKDGNLPPAMQNHHNHLRYKMILQQ